MTLTEQKKRRRQQFLQKRSALTDAEHRKASTRIIHTLLDRPEYQQSRVIHCYVSMNDRREVDTHALIKRMLQEGKKVVVPKMNPQAKTMTHIHLTEFDRLEENDWGILEPRSGAEVMEKDLDMVVVPMAGGDTDKNRIGYGGGFYDRFLSSLEASTIGLTYDCCIDPDGVPVEDHDVSLQKIITEKRVIE